MTDKTGEVAGTPADNLLIQGDSYEGLHALARNPEYAQQYRGKVKLVYIDPPFNTGQAFANYDDALEHSVWLTMMRDRLLVMRDLLSQDGSIWVHLDDSEMAYCRVMMDEIFGRSNFVTSIVWEKSDTLKMDAQLFSSRHDTILVYRKTPKFSVNRVGRSEIPSHYNKVDEDGRHYCTIPFKATGPDSTREARPTMYYPMIAPDGSEVFPKLSGGRDGRWVWKREKMEADIQRIDWVKGRAGWNPYYRIYADAGIGSPPDTWWKNAEVGSNRGSKREIKSLFPETAPFSTPKPERLIERVLQIASNPGDVVLDCFAGSGTTAAVAHKMGRRWVTTEILAQTVDTFTAPRLAKVVAGDDTGGITKAVGWEGGGGFRRLQVAPSAFEIVDGRVFLAEWVQGEDFAAVVAAQLGFSYASPSKGDTFCGRRGRARLAVVDGVVDEVVARGVIGQLDDGECAVLVGRGLVPEAETLVRELSPGSKVLKAPRDLVRRGKVVR
ncbi:site-specific DNA-methyltransferase [Streptacidiphilus sp. PB12-B1b]|uniref:site-specific DNA-methyltransferase n=1 Tax=Streptacidiphilus sp. PB12-B1b TaxID=2705012 RepID=UPI0015FBCA6A|nr:site-specific DNA-methyltransferase [Streptacidiphilus sp. PB12-B1b]QMU74864.1 site-specific DNA-methyltransferase [Streptacidiphilus sp. PB12-B1b]